MVKPVDLQDNLSKTQLLEKIAQIQKSSPEEAQKQFAQELQKKVANGENKVSDLPKSDKIIIHKDVTKKKKEHEDKKKKNKHKSTQECKDEDKNVSKNIDYLA